MTERPEMEEALSQEQERAQIPLGSMRDAVTSTDLSCNVTYPNPAAARMTGWTLQEAGVHWKKCFAFVARPRVPALRIAMATAIREARTARW